MSQLINDEFDESEMFSAPIAPIMPIMAPKAKTANPLGSYFRLPGLTVSLPTGGAFMPEGSIEFSQDGTLDVLPMKGSDEMLLMSPDALMNNSAILNLIQSCVPQIKEPEYVSVPDLDILLLAIRVASTGNKMELQLGCPECNEETKFEIDVPNMIQTAQEIEPVNTIRVRDDMVVWIRPLFIKDQTKLLNDVFRATRRAQALELNETLTDDEKTAATNDIMKSIAEMTTYGVSSAIIKIVIPDAEVTDPEFIREFLEKTDRSTMKKIKDRVDAINAMGVDKNFPATCMHCEHEWEASVEFDPSSFFGDRSSD